MTLSERIGRIRRILPPWGVDMGETRDAVEEKPRPSGKPAPPVGSARGIVGDLVDIEERLYNAADQKTRDLANEGEAAKPANQASKTRLERAAAHVKNAIDELRKY